MSATDKGGKGRTTAPAALQVVVPRPGAVNAAAETCDGTGKVDNGTTGADNALVAGGIPQIKTAGNSSEARTGLLTQLSAVQSSPAKLAEAIEINRHQWVDPADLAKGSCLTQTAEGYATELRLLLSDQHTSVVTATAPTDGIAAGWDGKRVVQARGLPDDRKAVSVKLANGTRYWVLWVNGDWVLPLADTPDVQAEASAPVTTARQPTSTSSSSRTGSQSGSGSGQSSTSSGTTTTAVAASTFGEVQSQAVQQAGASDQRDSARATQAATTTTAASPTSSAAVSTATTGATPTEVQGGGDPNGSAASNSAGASWSGCDISGNCP